MILSDLPLKRFKTISFDVLSVPAPFDQLKHQLKLQQIFELARALLLRTLAVFIVGVPPRGTEELQDEVLQLNADLNAFCNTEATLSFC